LTTQCSHSTHQHCGKTPGQRCPNASRQDEPTHRSTALPQTHLVLGLPDGSHFPTLGLCLHLSIIYRTHELAGLTTLQPGRPNNEPDADESRQALLNGFCMKPKPYVIECVDRIYTRNTVAEARVWVVLPARSISLIPRDVAVANNTLLFDRLQLCTNPTSWCHERERSGHRYYTRLINATPLRLTYSADERTLFPRWLGWDGSSGVLDMTSLSAHRQGSPAFSFSASAFTRAR
jgi:hypothetical protein